MYYFLHYLLLLIFHHIFFHKDTLTSSSSSLTSVEAKPNDNNLNSSREISEQYMEIKIGILRNEVLNIIGKHPLLEKDEETYYGDFDAEQKYIIRAKKSPIIDHLYLQFLPKDNINYLNTQEMLKDDNWKLYMIIIHFNPKYNNFNSLCEKLTFKYGKPDLRTSYKATWNAGKNKIQIVIDYPSTIKIYNTDDFELASKKFKHYNILTQKDYKKDIYNLKFLKDFE